METQIVKKVKIMMNNQWIKYNLGQVVDFLDCKRKPLQKEDRSKRSGQFPYFGATGVIDYIDDYLFDEEIILLGEDGANILSRQLPMAIRVTEKCWVNNHAHVLRPNDKVDGKYLTYLLESINYIPYNTGSAQPKINKQICEKIPIILPPLSEQKKIVEVLSTWDQVIETTNKLISAKEKQFKWLLKKLITDQKDNLNWKKEKLVQISEIKKGQQLNKITLNKTRGYPVQNGGMEPSGYTDKWNTRENTITISEGGNSCGFVKFNEHKFWSGGHCYSIINLSDKLENKFLFYYLKSNELKVMRLRVGSGLPNIQKKYIESFLIVYPDLKIQKKISDTLKYQEKEIKILNELSNKYKEQKKGLMQKLLTGEVKLQ